jgi:hypothetical protein
VWRKRNAKGLDLIHLDAHMDFDFHFAMPVEKVLNQARSIKELKQKLDMNLRD